jgi:signal transduction histidine kinase
MDDILVVLSDSVARLKREAALRERLSALGRFSAVIAHEVRNPLMIIKVRLAGRGPRAGRRHRSPGGAARPHHDGRARLRASAAG